MATTYELWTRLISGQEWTLSGTYPTWAEARAAGRPATGRPVQYIEVQEVTVRDERDAVPADQAPKA